MDFIRHGHDYFHDPLSCALFTGLTITPKTTHGRGVWNIMACSHESIYLGVREKCAYPASHYLKLCNNL